MGVKFEETFFQQDAWNAALDALLEHLAISVTSSGFLDV
jgi:hypothetical protein